MTETQKEFFRNYKFDKNIIITGDVGVGKTHIAKALLNKKEGLTYFISDAYFKELLSSKSLRLRKPEEWQSHIESFPLEMCIRAKVLVYDDIGVSDKTDAYIRKLTFVLNERMEKRLPTIFTTNLSPKELEEKLDKRVKSRIFSNAAFIEIKGEDRRKKGIEIIK